MSDNDNMLAAVTSMTEDEVIELIGLPNKFWDEHILSSGRDFRVRIDTFGLGYSLADERGPTAVVSFTPFIRRLAVTDEMLSSEADVVMTFLAEREAMPSGFYGHEGFPFLKWDWEDYGVRFNSHPQWWHRRESHILRQRLRTANVPFDAYLWEEYSVQTGIVTLTSDRKMIYLWGWRRPGNERLETALEILGCALGVTTGFRRYDRDPESHFVEIEGLEALVREVVAVANAEPERLQTALPGWRDALTGAVAMLINGGRPLPAVLDKRWEPLVVEAAALAPDLLEGENQYRGIERSG